MGAPRTREEVSIAPNPAANMASVMLEVAVISAISTIPVNGARTTPVKNAVIPTTANATGETTYSAGTSSLTPVDAAHLPIKFGFGVLFGGFHQLHDNQWSDIRGLLDGHLSRGGNNAVIHGQDINEHSQNHQDHAQDKQPVSVKFFLRRTHLRG